MKVENRYRKIKMVCAGCKTKYTIQKTKRCPIKDIVCYRCGGQMVRDEMPV